MASPTLTIRLEKELLDKIKKAMKKLSFASVGAWIKFVIRKELEKK